MSYYDNVEFQIPLPALDNGENSQFPAMGQFTGKSTDPNSAATPQLLPSALLSPPSGLPNNERGPYNYTYIKGIVYFAGVLFASQPFEIKNFHDYPYASIASGPFNVANGNVDAFEDYTNLTSTGYEQYLLINQVRLDRESKILSINAYTDLGDALVTAGGFLTIKGTYLFI